MGIMVKALAIFLRSANSTFAPSGWFMHALSHIMRHQIMVIKQSKMFTLNIFHCNTHLEDVFYS